MNNGFCAPARRAHSRRLEKPQGFTLVEMMVVISLMAIMLSIALPGFGRLIEKYRVEGMASALMASVIHARSEAVRRARTVTIQPRAGCSGRDWSCGWDTVVGSGDAIETLQRQDPDTRVAVQKSVLGAMSFDAMGNSAGVAGFSLHPAGNAGSSSAAAVCVALGGRVRLVKGSGTC